MSKDIIEEKIKKLLRMKRGGTPDEIATALRLAQELADKHGIDLNGLDPDDERSNHERPITHTDALLAARIQWECKYAALVCQRFFNIKFLLRQSYRQHRVTFIGTEWDNQIALYVYGFIVGHFRREWKTKRGRLRNRQAFMYGMYIGLASKLAERQPVTPQTPGVLATDRQLTRRNEYMAKTFGQTTSEDTAPENDSDKARWRGYLAGRDTEIRSGVNGAGANRPEALTGTDSVKLLG